MPLYHRFENLTDLNLIDFNLTMKEQQLICALDLQEAVKLREEQKIIARRLKHHFQHGSCEVYQDLEKADQYRSLYKEKKNQLEQQNKHKNILSSIFTVSNFYYFNGWFTSIRLFLARVDKISLNIIGRAFLPRLFSIGGFSYGIMLLADIYVIIKSVFFAPVTKTEQHLTFLQRCARRFKTLMLTKKGFLSQIFNNFIWFVFNLSAFILTGGAAVLINVVGFGCDVAHESFKASLDKIQCVGLQKKITHKILVETQALNNLENKQAELYTFLKKLKNPLYDRVKIQAVNKQIKEIEKQIEDKKNTLKELTHLNDGLTQKQNEIMKRRYYTVFFTCMAFVGVVLAAFPGANVLGCVLLGSALTLLAGSIMQGFGKRLYEHAMLYIPKVFSIIMKNFSINKNKQLKVDPPQIEATKATSPMSIEKSVPLLKAPYPTPSLPIPIAIPRAIQPPIASSPTFPFSNHPPSPIALNGLFRRSPKANIKQVKGADQLDKLAEEEANHYTTLTPLIPISA